MKNRRSLFALPYVVWMALFVVAPVILMVVATTIAAPILLKLTFRHEGSSPSQLSDETAGQLTTFLLVAPFLQHNLSLSALTVYLLGFGLFRFFDILKMGPVKWADSKLKNAWGVMLDDVFAGIFAAIVLFLIVSRF